MYLCPYAYSYEYRLFTGTDLSVSAGRGALQVTAKHEEKKMLVEALHQKREAEVFEELGAKRHGSMMLQKMDAMEKAIKGAQQVIKVYEDDC